VSLVFDKIRHFLKFIFSKGIEITYMKDSFLECAIVVSFITDKTEQYLSFLKFINDFSAFLRCCV